MKRPPGKWRWAIGFALLAGIVAGGLSSCATVNPYFDAAKPHRAREGFRNNYDNSDKQSFWRWQLERWQSGVPFPPKSPTPVATPDSPA